MEQLLSQSGALADRRWVRTGHKRDASHNHVPRGSNDLGALSKIALFIDNQISSPSLPSFLSLPIPFLNTFSFLGLGVLLLENERDGKQREMLPFLLHDYSFNV